MFDGGGKSFILKMPNGKIKVLNFDRINEIVNTYICTELSFRRASKDFAQWYTEQLEIMQSRNA